MTVVIGGNRDSRPHTAPKPRKGSEVGGEARWEEERACRPISQSLLGIYYGGGMGLRQVRALRPPTGNGLGGEKGMVLS